MWDSINSPLDRLIVMYTEYVYEIVNLVHGPPVLHLRTTRGSMDHRLGTTGLQLQESGCEWVTGKLSHRG